MQQGSRNTMVTLGMIAGPLALPRPTFAIGREHLIQASRDGRFVPLKALEQAPRQGELLG